MPGLTIGGGAFLLHGNGKYIYCSKWQPRKRMEKNMDSRQKTKEA